MNYEWIDGFCMKMHGVTKDYKPEWDANRYFLGGKMFAMMASNKEGRPIFTMKLEPPYGELLRKQYPADIVPGYYMNKAHWNSLHLEGTVPNEVVEEMLRESYQTMLKALPKQVQAELANG